MKNLEGRRREECAANIQHLCQAEEFNSPVVVDPVGREWRLTPWVLVPIDRMARRRDYNQAARRRIAAPEEIGDYCS
jgi:hypothetical protein